MFKLAYRDLDLPIYRLHPAAKMLLSFSFVLAAGLVQSLSALAALAVIFLATALAAGLRLSGIYALIRPFRFFLIFTFAVQLFLAPMGQWVLPEQQSLMNSLFFTLRMLVIIGFSALFAVITPMTDIVRLFYLIFQPLRIIRISPADTAMSMLIALRFIPLLFTEGEKIIDAQRLKGLLPECGEKMPLMLRIRSAVALVVPLFVRTFHYADQISITLAYRRNDTSFFQLARPGFHDIASIFFFVALAAGVLVLT